MINKITLVGWLHKSAEVKYLSNDKRVMSFSISLYDSVKNSSGGWDKRREWFHVEVFNQYLFDFADRAKSGDLVYIEGKLRRREYKSNTGESKVALEVLISGSSGTLKLLTYDGGTSGSVSKSVSTGSDVSVDSEDVIPF